IERDVLAAVENAATGEGIGGRGHDGYIGGAKREAAVAAKAAEAAEYIDEKMPPIRRAIAKSMTKSLTEIAQLTHHHSCDATVILNLRRRLKQDGGRLGLDGVTIGDMVLYAAVRTLREHPCLNAHLIDGDTLRKFGGVHLGMAVDTPRGLMVPTIFDADCMSLRELSITAKELAARAKSGNISPDLLTGATFTVSNLGALGVEMFTPVINPPQVAILGVCGIITKVRGADGGSLTAYQSMGLSLTYDHRAIDGADASRFARDLTTNIENLDLLTAT
ncbi:MAG: 2-oxo acid dehydrogenase subunit E2, partial [Clostridiales bacterium]|nr:2-oxo acid dehydrogenase subunit E2 [Clostridiales bacterium]